MSTSNINNGKRHVRDRAYYGGVPNKKKRVKFTKKEENKKITIKYNLCAVSTALLVTNHLEGNEAMKILIIFLALFSGLQYFEGGEK